MNHLVFGIQGTGKSTFLINDALDKHRQGAGVIFFDPIGKHTDTLLACLPANTDVIVIDPTDIDYPIPINPLEYRHPDEIPTVVKAVLDGLKAAAKYDDAGTNLYDLTVSYTAYAVSQTLDPTLLGMLQFLEDKDKRNEITDTIQDKLWQTFWQRFPTRSAKNQEETLRSTINQLYLLLGDPRLRYMLSRKKSAISFRDILNSNKFVIIRLPVGQLSRSVVYTLGAIINTQLFSALSFRTSTDPFYLYYDDTEYFASAALSNLLAYAPNHYVYTTYSLKFLGQLPYELRDAFIGHSPDKTIFRLAFDDAAVMQKLMPYNATKPQLHEMYEHHAAKIRSDQTEPEYDDIDDLRYAPRWGLVAKHRARSRARYSHQRKDLIPIIDRFLETPAKTIKKPRRPKTTGKRKI